MLDHSSTATAFLSFHLESPSAVVVSSMPSSAKTVSKVDDASRASVRALASELKKHADSEKQLSELKNRITKTNNRARTMVEMVETRIAYLAKEWGMFMEGQNSSTVRQLETVGGNSQKAVSVRLPISSEQMVEISGRLNQMKDKIEKLAEMEKLTRTLQRKAGEDNAALKASCDKTRDLEQRQKKLVAAVAPPTQEELKAQAINNMRIGLGGLEMLGNLNSTNRGMKDKINKVADELQVLLKIFSGDAADSSALQNGEIGLVNELPVLEVVDSLHEPKNLTSSAGKSLPPTSL